MKINRISLKLASYFVSSLLLFALVIGSVFFFLFKNYTIDVQREERMREAQALAATFSEQEDQSHHQQMMNNSNAYLRFIEEVGGNHVWLVAPDEQILATGSRRGAMNHMNDNSMIPSPSPLPELASEVLPLVFKGETISQEGFDHTLDQQTLTIGVPVTDDQQNIWASILLQAPISGFNDAVQQGFNIFFISLLIALLIALLFAFFLSYSFTKPLAQMKTTALKLIQGDYTAQTQIKQKDEIGELANTLDTLANRLEFASQESQKLEQMRQDYVANISHELRTPVTVLRGSLEALNDGVITDPKKVKEYHHQMFLESLFLERLVDDLLELSRLQNLDFKIEKVPISLQDVLNDALRSGRQLAKEKQLTFKVNIDNNPLIFLGDYGRLRQMFLIVLANAIKFSPINSAITVELSANKLTITDQGPGIKEEDLPYIFDRFHKTYGEKNKTGTGLGLAIARQIAQRHAILVTVKNTPTAGARFIFDFSKLERLDVTTLENF